MKQLMIAIAVILLAGCGAGESGKKEESSKAAVEKTEKKEEGYQEKKVEYVELDSIDRELTDTEKELLRKPGKFSGDNYDEEKVQAELDKLPKDLTAKQYMEEMIYLLGEDYHEGMETFFTFDSTVDVKIDRPDGKIDNPQLKKTHVAILMDSSGSMNGKVGGKTKMEAAKEAVTDFAKLVPEQSTVSLSVYGHKGSGEDADKKLSCSSTETVYNGSYDDAKFKDALNTFKPAGWTPIANALNSVEKDIPADAQEVVVYVVSDGIETCDGDPVAAAKKLSDSNNNVKTVVNIIGFDVDNEGQALLKDVADAGNGEFKYVDSERELKDYMRKQCEELQKEWYEWKEAGKEQAFALKEEKKKLANETKEEMKEKVTREKDRLKAAQSYLNEKYDDYDHPINDTFSLIIDRNNGMWQYIVDKGNKLWNESVDNGNEEWNNYVEEGNDKINETIDKKNDY
ncbi:VWA domain-containing protein [Rossellomorea aquimaris]|uniref:VWA domain-containing protein n=1 Tax=Rossellomorea aquimaris TaxID=189382 RepID=UPI001CD41F18|nr:VWA domain-containing protein [Rossellomorea aquimaris]MCA1055454.1 VWA domain-containing protein [Rossellomorea aquimaris]